MRVAKVVVRVVVFSVGVRFQTKLLLVGDQQGKQDGMVHGVCLVQVWRVSCCGVSGCQGLRGLR